MITFNIWELDHNHSPFNISFTFLKSLVSNTFKWVSVLIMNFHDDFFLKCNFSSSVLLWIWDWIDDKRHWALWTHAVEWTWTFQKLFSNLVYFVDSMFLHYWVGIVSHATCWLDKTESRIRDFMLCFQTWK